MIHVLHDEQFSLVKKFLGCFVKPECIKDLRPKKLAHLEIKQEPEFVEKAKSAFKNCATYLLKKMPINNFMLRLFSAIDSQAQDNEITLRHLKCFLQLTSNVLNKEEEQKFGEEV